MPDLTDAECICPRCHHAMEPGFIDAGYGPMRWGIRSGQHTTILGGERLVSGHESWGRHLLMLASRCPHCRVGLFAYDDGNQLSRRGE